MNMKMVLLASAMLVGGSVMASAADRYVPTVPVPSAAPAVQNNAPARAFNWTGFYAGAHVGWDWVSLWTDSSTSAAFKSVGLDRPNSNGFSGGIHGGYDWQMPNNFVVGLRGEFDLRDQSETKYDSLGLGSWAKARSTYEGFVAAKGGYAFDRILPYGLVGVSFADYEISGGGVGGSASQKKTLWGLGVGAGIDYAITDNITAGLEYRYDYFSKVDYNDLGSKIGAGVNGLKANVSYKF